MNNPEKVGVGGLIIDQNESIDQGLGVHAPVEVETGLIDGSDVIYHSVSPISNSGPIEFIVPHDNECSFILNQTRLSGHFVVQSDRDEPITDRDKITLVNHFSACLFSQVEVYLNGTQVADLSSANSYPWKMFIQSYLSYGTNVKDSILQAEGYYKEKATEADDTCDANPVEARQPGSYARRQLITGGKKVHFNSRLCVDLFHTDRFLPPNIDIKIKLIRNRETFGLLYNNQRIVPGAAAQEVFETVTYKIVLQDLKLHMRKVLPTLRERDNYKARLMKSPCYLPYKATTLRHFTLAQGATTYNIANVVTGILPKTIIFAMINNTALPHDRKSNPFNFQHFNLTRFNLKKNGQNVFPKPFETDFATGDVLDLYCHLYDSVGTKHGNDSCGLTIEEFKKGKTFLVADLNPDQCNSYHIHPDVYGNLDLELTFAQELTQAIYVFAFAIYNSGIKIDQNWQVIKGNQS